MSTNRLVKLHVTATTFLFHSEDHKIHSNCLTHLKNPRSGSISARLLSGRYRHPTYSRSISRVLSKMLHASNSSTTATSSLRACLARLRPKYYSDSFDTSLPSDDRAYLRDVMSPQPVHAAIGERVRRSSSIIDSRTTQLTPYKTLSQLAVGNSICALVNPRSSASATPISTSTSTTLVAEPSIPSPALSWLRSWLWFSRKARKMEAECDRGSSRWTQRQQKAITRIRGYRKHKKRQKGELTQIA